MISEPQHAQAACRHIAGNWMYAKRKGRPLIVTIEVEHKQRTQAQNNRLHALIREIAEHPIGGQRFGFEALKEYVARRWIGTETIDLPDGTRIERAMSTASLTVEACAKLMDILEAWATVDLGIELSPP